MIVDVLVYFRLRCRSPKFRYFCTTETVGVNFTGFLIALAKMLLLRRRTFPIAGTILFCRWKNPVQNFDKLRKGFSHWQNGGVPGVSSKGWPYFLNVKTEGDINLFYIFPCEYLLNPAVLPGLSRAQIPLTLDN